MQHMLSGGTTERKKQQTLDSYKPRGLGVEVQGVVSSDEEERG